MELKLKGTSILWRIFSHLIVFYIIVKLCNHYLNLNLESLFEPIDPEVSEEIELTTPQLIEKYKYKVEIHHVTTEDGYILEMHRITGSPNSPSNAKKSPVLLLPGLADSSATWIIMRPSHGLGYLLADEGFDVWLGNARGSRYSRNHTTLDPDGHYVIRKQFWDFSWHEIGVYDIPAMIDFILEMTENKKLHYIAHSQGTTAFFVMASERPEYNDKIILGSMMAPSAYLNPTTHLMVKFWSSFTTPLEFLANSAGIYELFPNGRFTKTFAKYLCGNRFTSRNLCASLLCTSMGKNSDQFNDTMTPIVLGHVPSGCSGKQLSHYGQLVKSKRFQKFDYGSTENVKRYNDDIPPEYNLNNVRAKLVLYYVENDGLILRTNVERLMNQLPNVIGSHVIEHKMFYHLDYVWGINARTQIYENVVKDMKSIDELEAESQSNEI